VDRQEEVGVGYEPEIRDYPLQKEGGLLLPFFLSANILSFPADTKSIKMSLDNDCTNLFIPKELTGREEIRPASV
jgi:hypothetical protein